MEGSFGLDERSVKRSLRSKLQLLTQDCPRSGDARMCIEPGLQGKRLSKYLVFSRATGESVFNCCSDESMMQEVCLGFA